LLILNKLITFLQRITSFRKPNIMKTIILIFSLAVGNILQSGGHSKIENDFFDTSSGKLKISFIGHASLVLEIKGKIIHIDPWGELADYSLLPKADLILLTHHHPDHLDTNAISKLMKNGTQIILTRAAFNIVNKGTVMNNGDKRTIGGITIEAVPAYNVTVGRDKFHPKGRDNGYILTIGGKRIYIAGDTENIDEMADFKNIDIAFLPMNQPYTMLPEQIVDAISKIKPKIFYPYHYGDSDIGKLKRLLSKNTQVEVRIRALK